jgi:glycosyltransferase involved in cell wall biosynthesis
MAFGRVGRLASKERGELMQNKRIAVLIDWYLPGNKAGGPVKSVFSLLSLLKSDFDFFIITVNCDLGSDEPYRGIEPNSWTKHNDIPIYYFSKEELNGENLTKTINDLKVDIIYLNSFWSYYFSILILQLKRKNKIHGKIVLAPRGMLSKGALSLKTFKKRAFIFLSKLTGIHKNILFHATTKQEESEIKDFYPNATIKIASNVNSTALLKNKTTFKTKGELKLFFLSRVARVKNVHFALQLLSEIKVEGNIIYDIYGSLEEKEYWNECEEIIKTLPSNIKVNYKGALSFENVQSTIRSYHYLFLPTLNENYGHSIVESLLSACPVIISDQTPWSGVNENNCGKAIALSNKEKFKSEIINALNLDNAAYSEISKNCITFIEKRIDIGQNIKAYKELFL